MKVNFHVKLVVEFDKSISPTNFDDLLISLLKQKFGDQTELIPSFGGGEYILIIKDVISDK